VRKAYKKSTYIPVSALRFRKWTHLGSNQGPPDYESGALTNSLNSLTIDYQVLRNNYKIVV
jgi:hypothetical protein